MDPRPLQILVGIDFSECSAEALRYAVGVARDVHAELDVVHVHPYGRAQRLVETVLARDEFHRFMEAKAQLSAFCDQMIPDGIVHREHMRLGEPAQELLDAVDVVQPDVVVVGRHGSGLRHALLGSVSSKVANHSEVAVVVVPEGSTQAAQSVRGGADVAWSCAACGHIRKPGEDTVTCGSCGARPARWNSAPLVPHPPEELESAKIAPR